MPSPLKQTKQLVMLIHATAVEYAEQLVYVLCQCLNIKDYIMYIVINSPVLQRTKSSNSFQYRNPTVSAYACINSEHSDFF